VRTEKRDRGKHWKKLSAHRKTLSNHRGGGPGGSRLRSEACSGSKKSGTSYEASFPRRSGEAMGWRRSRCGGFAVKVNDLQPAEQAPPPANSREIDQTKATKRKKKRGSSKATVQTLFIEGTTPAQKGNGEDRTLISTTRPSREKEQQKERSGGRPKTSWRLGRPIFLGKGSPSGERKEMDEINQTRRTGPVHECVL